MNELVTGFDDPGRYKTLVEAVTDYAIYMLDPNGIVSSWNAGAQRFKGYAAEEIVGQHFSQFYTEEDIRSGLPARALETAAREGKFESEGWRVRRDGTRFWAHVVIDPIRNAQGVLTGYAKVTRDLTERKKAADELKRSEEQFARLVQGVTDYAIYMLSPGGIVSSWNSGAARIKGYSAAEIIGSHFSRFYTDEDRERGDPQRALDTAAREGRSEKEGWRVRKDGTRFWSHVVIDAIRGDDGEIIGFAKITRDVTERRETQIALDQAREALFQSQKMDAIGQLTGGVAHDFNNLLMAVIGSLELLRRRMPDEPQLTRLVDNAMAGAQRGASLTQRMLAFARRQQLDTKPLDLPVVVRSMTDFLTRSIGPGVRIETHFPLKLARAMADENQLELAILNLCVNARDAMDGNGTLVISAEERRIEDGNAVGLPAGNYVSLNVIDTGEGMSPETLARAAEPFFTTKGVGKGTGLGLAMVHGMSAQMGGRLVLKSCLGKGTTAQIWLPAAAATTAPEAAVAAEPEPAPQRRALRVLAVDDDALVLFNTTAMLEELGHSVVEAYSADAALEALGRESFDLLITDQAMPQMTGTQLIERVKRDWPGLPVILATGYAELPGGVPVPGVKLNKPFSEKALADAVAAAFPLQPAA
jgi:PAS domain S-box-containing protein